MRKFFLEAGYTCFKNSRTEEICGADMLYEMGIKRRNVLE